jgi:hypothetical protein
MTPELEKGYWTQERVPIGYTGGGNIAEYTDFHMNSIYNKPPK